VLAPTAFAWGLQRSGALAGSLLLNLEALFTVGLAVLFYREPMGRRVLLACSLMLAAGALLALRQDADFAANGLGLGALAGAALGWALDNTLTRPLADLEPRSVVFWKAALGASLSSLLAFQLADPWPPWRAVLALVACGASGYGLSLRLYLRAQRVLGAARTGSLFALAPFLGAGVAFALGDRQGAPLVAVAALLCAVAAYLHVSEQHEHRHFHEPLEHEHAHRHDDGHHDHAHHPPVHGSHTHSHHHDAVEHAHPHAADLHHRHRHE
jgi:drug/metabolite transporter (DMT)-like permease